MGACCSRTEHKSMDSSKKSEYKYKNSIDVINLSKFTIFDLTVNCFDEIFEYLSLKDLHSFGRTCKAMQQITGQYFKQNYPAAKIVCVENGINVDPHNENRTVRRLFFYTPISGFESFINSISIDLLESQLQYVHPYIDQFESVKCIRLLGQILSRENVAPMRKTLYQVETMQIQIGCVCHDLHDILLKFCGNLKRLYVQNCDFDIIYYEHFLKRKWLMQAYPKLEHFEYIPRDSLILNELNSFLERNKKICTFSTSVECLWKNRHAFINSEAKLDVLEVKCFEEIGSDEPTLQSLCDLCNQLHEKGFFKRLHLYIQTVDEEFNAQAVRLNGLEKLCIKRFYGTLPPLTGLKELAILDYLKDLDEPNDDAMETIANDLVNLQRLYLNNANTIDDIMPFIRQSMKLNEIKVLLKEERFLRKQIISPSQLNRERKKLFEACKVTIYVSEKSFMDTKWATRYGDTNLTLIEIKRADSYEWNQHYQ